jgi:hypothetical protein
MPVAKIAPISTHAGRGDPRGRPERADNAKRRPNKKGTEGNSVP